MLSNNMREADQRILNGQMTPRQMLLDQIQQFLKTKDKGKIDFSYSLFLPEFLNPKFFQELSEAEHIVLVGNLSKYFEFLSKFNTIGVGLRGTWKPGHELNPPQLLIKHILADEKGIYTNRVKMMAWNQLCQELDKLSPTSGAYKLFSQEKIEKAWNENFEKLQKKDLDTLMVDEWMKTAEGVFESFELDCTLHNVDATDFLLDIMKHVSNGLKFPIEFRCSFWSKSVYCSIMTLSNACSTRLLSNGDMSCMSKSVFMKISLSRLCSARNPHLGSVMNPMSLY
jgi:hypothetical protein